MPLAHALFTPATHDEPAGHVVQVVALPGEYEPGVQGVAETPSHFFPTGHTVQILFVVLVHGVVGY